MGVRPRCDVLVIVQNLSVPLDRRVWLECLALTGAGYRVSVICPQGPGELHRESLQGVEVYRYTPPAPATGVLGYAKEFAYSWLATSRLARRVWREQGFRVMQVCNPPDTYASLGRHYRRRGVLFVYDQHDLSPELYLSRFERGEDFLHRRLVGLERATYRAADHVISTNDSYKAIAMERGGKVDADVTVVRSGPDTQAMSRGPQDPTLRRGRDHLAVYLGVMGPQDGVDLVLRSLRVLVDRGQEDLHVALLGFGDCYDELVALSAELELDDYVTFTGRADAATVATYLSTADIGLCPDPPSPLNDLSTMNKVMEYMSFEVPMVSCDLKESRVSAQDAALYVDAPEPESFANGIEQLLKDPVMRDELARTGRRRAVTVLDWRGQAEKYVGVYRRLLGTPTGIDLPVARHPAVSATSPVTTPVAGTATGTATGMA